jgi:hypothetical protein
LRKKHPYSRGVGFFEATTGFEPVIGVLQTLALPLGYVAWKTKTDIGGRLWPVDTSHRAFAERAKRLELSTFSLARRRSTIELHPRVLAYRELHSSTRAGIRQPWGLKNLAPKRSK